MTEDTEFGRDLIDVRGIRERLGLSRVAFARRFGLEASTVRSWELGFRQDTAARVLLKVIGRDPDVVAAAVSESRAA